jgi:short-subunit dehydrogenase
VSWTTYFKNTNVLLTGACSGVGLELATRLSSVAKSLILIDLNQDRLTKVRKSFASPTANILGYDIDVTDQQRMQALLTTIPAQHQPQIIIANAGLGGVNPGDNFSFEINKKIMEVNYFGTVNTLMPFVPGMIEKRSGHLVGVSSLASLRGMPFASSYCSSKAAQNNFLESLRNDLSPYGIRVTTVLPGFIKSPMTAHDEFKMPFMISAGQAAENILNAVASLKKTHMFPWQMKIISTINRFLPAWLFDLILPRLTGRGQKKKPQIFSKSTDA